MNDTDLPWLGERRALGRNQTGENQMWEVLIHSQKGKALKVGTYKSRAAAERAARDWREKGIVDPPHVFVRWVKGTDLKIWGE